jgi:hypothetical protein
MFLSVRMSFGESVAARRSLRKQMEIDTSAAPTWVGKSERVECNSHCDHLAYIGGATASPTASGSTAVLFAARSPRLLNDL